MKTNRLDKLAGRTALYRFWDAKGDLLYVGITHDTTQRWKSHARNQPWWTNVARKEVIWMLTRKEAEAAERIAHRTEAPRYDKTGTRNLKDSNLSPLFRHRDAAVEEMIREAMGLIISDLRSATYPAWSAVPQVSFLAARYSLPLVAVTWALRRLAMEGHELVKVGPRYAVVGEGRFPAEEAAAFGLLYVLAVHHFGCKKFTIASLAERSGYAPTSVGGTLKKLMAKGLASVHIQREGRSTVAYYAMIPVPGSKRDDTA